MIELACVLEQFRPQRPHVGFEPVLRIGIAASART
jgi:hypothetical protein